MSTRAPSRIEIEATRAGLMPREATPADHEMLRADGFPFLESIAAVRASNTRGRSHSMLGVVLQLSMTPEQAKAERAKGTHHFAALARRRTAELSPECVRTLCLLAFISLLLSFLFLVLLIFLQTFLCLHVLHIIIPIICI